MIKYVNARCSPNKQLNKKNLSNFKRKSLFLKMKTSTGLNFSTWISAKIIQNFCHFPSVYFLVHTTVEFPVLFFVLLAQNQLTVKVILENQTFSKIWAKSWPPPVCSFSVLWPTILVCGALVFPRVCFFTHPHVSSPLPSVPCLLYSKHSLDFALSPIFVFKVFGFPPFLFLVNLS